MRVFLDTNVVVSALATRGLCADLVEAILAEHELVLGETVLREVRSVLTRKLRVPGETVDEVEAHLRNQATTVVEARKSKAIGGLDAADSAVVAEAVAAKADVLVSGDGDLLELEDSPVKIVSPRGLWEKLRRAT